MKWKYDCRNLLQDKFRLPCSELYSNSSSMEPRLINVERSDEHSAVCMKFLSLLSHCSCSLLHQCDVQQPIVQSTASSTSDFINRQYFWRMDSAVGTATGYGLKDRGVGVRVPVRARLFSSPLRPDRLWVPPSLVSNVYRELFPPGVKRPVREADHLSPAIAEVKKIWICTSTSTYSFMTYCLIS
jgi:hypothetical protein